MGAVYKASQPEMNRMVGVKILHPKLANRKDLVSRFGREARAMSHLTHPNTVKVFLYGELDDGSLYIIMEFLEGKNLNQSVRAEGPFPVERALPILIMACGALRIMWHDLAEVRSLAVSDRARGLGLGRSLVERLLEEAREHALAAS